MGGGGVGGNQKDACFLTWAAAWMASHLLRCGSLGGDEAGVEGEPLFSQPPGHSPSSLAPAPTDGLHVMLLSLCSTGPLSVPSTSQRLCHLYACPYWLHTTSPTSLQSPRTLFSTPLQLSHLEFKLTCPSLPKPTRTGCPLGLLALLGSVAQLMTQPPIRRLFFSSPPTSTPRSSPSPMVVKLGCENCSCGE